MFGLLNIDKPPGLTSRDAVNRVQRLIRPIKVGHAGTLDPLATGVLVVAVGPATRLIEYIHRMPKTYQGTFRLGETSDTEDIEGQIVALPSPSIPTREQFEAAIPRFLGRIHQRPPAYSALKIAGQRAHELARRGESVELAPRPIEIHSFQIRRYEYPEIELLIRCGSGTYIRSLGRDLAQSLGTGAVMSALRRLAIGPFGVQEAIPCDGLTRETIERQLLPATLALADIPQVVLDGQEEQRAARGQELFNRFGIAGREVAALSSNGQLAAVLTIADQHLRPAKCFLAQ